MRPLSILCAALPWLLAPVSGCYLVASGRIDQTCEDLKGGCTGADPVPEQDIDGDGYSRDQGDCDDNDAAVNPGAAERCDAADIDEDCDGLVNDADTEPEGQQTHYADADEDGWGDEADRQASCAVPAGRAVEPGDCTDSDPSQNPGVAEACGDGLDNNCDGVGGCTPFSDVIRADRAAGARLRWPTGGGGYGTRVVDLDRDGRAEVLVAGAYGGPEGNGGIYLGQVGRGDDLALDSSGWGSIVGTSAAPVGVGLVAGTVLPGGGWGIATADYSGNIMVFDADALRGGRVLTAADAVRAGAGLSVFSEDAMPLATADVSGDGQDELIVGASTVYHPDYAGFVATFLGGERGALSPSTAYGVIFGRRPGGSSFGASVAAGDLTGDGLPELVASDPYGYVDETGGYDGYVTVFGNRAVRGVGSATDADLTVVASTPGEGLGWQLGVQDVNDDGYGDLYMAQSGSGTGVVFTAGATGVLRSADASMRFEGVEAYSNSGLWAGDVDGDGDTDLVLGSLSDDTGGTWAGALVVRYGPVRSGAYEAGVGDAVIYGNTPYGYFGFRGALGDVDGDGGLDIVARTGDGSGSAVFFGGGF